MEAGQVTSVELLEQALEAARQLGFKIREDCLGGSAGGTCQIKGQKWLFLDPALPTRERLQLVIEAIAREPQATALEISAPLSRVLRLRQSA